MGAFKLALALASLPSALAAAAAQKAPEEEKKYTFHIPETLKDIDMTTLGLPGFITEKLSKLTATRHKVWCESTKYDDDNKPTDKIIERELEFKDGEGSVNAKMCEGAYVSFKEGVMVFRFAIGIFKGDVVAGKDKELSKLMFVGMEDVEDDGPFPLESETLANGVNAYIRESSVLKLPIELVKNSQDGKQTLEAIKVTQVEEANQDETKVSGVNHLFFLVENTNTILKIGNFHFVIARTTLGSGYVKSFKLVNALLNKPQYTTINGIEIHTKCVGFPRAANFASLGKSGFWTMWYLVPIVLVLVVAAGAVAWFLGLIGGGSKPEESEDLSSRLSSSSVEGGEIEIEASS